MPFVITFLTCERSISPELVGKPIVVLSNNDRCIIACSNEAKTLGYKIGEGTIRLIFRVLKISGEKNKP